MEKTSNDAQTQVIPIRFTAVEMTQLEAILKQYPTMNRSAVIKHRLFKLRKRATQKTAPVDLVFLATLCTQTECLLADARRGYDIVPAVKELLNQLNDQLSKSRV